MPINQDDIATRVCALTAAWNLSIDEYRDRPEQRQYYAKLLYLVQAQVLLVEDALVLVKPLRTITESRLFMREWAAAKYDLEGHIISDLSIVDMGEIDSLPDYFVALCSTYLLALGNAINLSTGNTAINEIARFTTSLFNLLSLAETVLAENNPLQIYAQVVAEFEAMLKQSVDQDFFPNGVPRAKSVGDALLMSLGLTFSGADGQGEGVSDLQHLRLLMDDAGVDY